MPTDTIAEEVQAGLKAANQALRSKQIDADSRRHLVLRLKNLDERLSHDIEMRKTSYLAEIRAREDADIDAKCIHRAFPDIAREHRADRRIGDLQSFDRVDLDEPDTAIAGSGHIERAAIVDMRARNSSGVVL